MGQPWPQFPSDVQGGDEATFSPAKSQNSLLAAQRGTQETRRIETDASGNVYVTVAGGTITVLVSDNGTNIIASNTAVPSGVETTILSHTVTTPFKIAQLVGWGNIDAEFLIKLNGVLVGGGISSPSVRTLDVHYDKAPIPTSIGDIVTVTVFQISGSNKILRVNLLGE